MIGTEERMEIAARAAAVACEDEESAPGMCGDVCRVLGVRMDNTSDDWSRELSEVIDRIEELCEPPEPLDGTDEERDLAALVSAHVKRAVMEGVTDTAIDAIREAVDGELACQREQVRNDCDGCKSIPVPLGRDGVPVMPDDTVYGEDGVVWRVLGLRTGDYPVCAMRAGSDRWSDGFRALRPEWLTHRSDTAASLADELEAMCNGLAGDARTATRARDLRGIAERMRGLGERS